MRARELGIVVGSMEPGVLNAITDVAGVRVGHCSVVSGDDVRTGVTVVFPHEGEAWADPVFAAPHRLNGNGELTGLEWVRESGMLHSPIGLTNSHSVGVVRDALVAYEIERRGAGSPFWSLPVVGETWDGVLNDINGLHVRPEHVLAAIADASSGPVAEGNVGSGTGMICHGFKGGIGTASRRFDGWTVGVLVQANHGQRSQLRVDGAPVGRLITADEVPTPVWQGEGSIIGIVATDAPLLPMQCARLAQRAALGVTRAGGLGEHFSGDILLCFSTGNRGLPPNVYSSEGARTVGVSMTGNAWMNGLFQAAVEATEEAILNTLLAAETMTGRGGATAHALEPARLTAALVELGRAV